MAKGSIRFDDLINVEVAVDPTQAAGAKLLSAVNLVDGQSLGGGGGGDFSTAEITYTGLTSSLYVVGISPDDGSSCVTAMLTNGTKTVILYKGKAYVDVSDLGEDAYTISGDAEFDGDDGLLISGNCSIEEGEK